MGATVAVKATDWPMALGLSAEFRARLVAAGGVVNDQTGEDVAPAAAVEITFQ